jgi:signal peptidase I
MNISLGKIWKENKSLLLFLLLMFMFRSSFADWNTVPTGSMKPTILEGDRLLVNKMAYDIRFPFTHISMYEVSDPVRGDIVIFDSEVSKRKLVKRVIGVPGDVVELRDNILFVNGERASYTNVSSNEATTDKYESRFGVEHLIRVTNSGSRLSNFPSVTVPPDYYLALGDNRDESADSRVIGFVPRKELSAGREVL